MKNKNTYIYVYYIYVCIIKRKGYEFIIICPSQSNFSRAKSPISNDVSVRDQLPRLLIKSMSGRRSSAEIRPREPEEINRQLEYTTILGLSWLMIAIYIYIYIHTFFILVFLKCTSIYIRERDHPDETWTPLG